MKFPDFRPGSSVGRAADRKSACRQFDSAPGHSPRSKPSRNRRSRMVDPNEQAVVVVHGRGDGFAQEITAGRHRLIADEPVSAGGTDRGLGPYDLLLAGLGAWTGMSNPLNATRHRWPVTGLRVRPP